MTVAEVQTNELWMLNPATQKHVLKLAGEFVGAHEVGDRQTYREAIVRLDGVFEGYFLAQGVELPQEALNALRSAAIRQARAAHEEARA